MALCGVMPAEGCRLDLSSQCSSHVPSWRKTPGSPGSHSMPLARSSWLCSSVAWKIPGSICCQGSEHLPESTCWGTWFIQGRPHTWGSQAFVLLALTFREMGWLLVYSAAVTKYCKRGP